jgi:hypothetical protein
MHVDEPHITPLPWWFPPLLLLALLCIWPLMVDLVAQQPPDNVDAMLKESSLAAWRNAYGEGLDAEGVRSTIWSTKSSRPFLLDTPWAKAFPMRLFTLAALWSILAIAAARNPRGIPIPPWMTWSTWSIALFPWAYLLLSAGAGRGYAELMAAKMDLLSTGSPITSYSVPISDPPTETLLALGALAAIFAILLAIEIRTTGKIPTLADLLRLDLDERDPGRVLHGMPKMQRNPEVFLAPDRAADDASS